jgi:catechol 2,3-dioxygenase-like lactoylglutathione lyase family enzyme
MGRQARVGPSRPLITVAKLRHLALATDDPDATAQFYVDSFDFKEYEDLDGVVFDLGGPGVWNVARPQPHN